MKYLQYNIQNKIITFSYVWDNYIRDCEKLYIYTADYRNLRWKIKRYIRNEIE
jgi:hypothetical protein